MIKTIKTVKINIMNVKIYSLHPQTIFVYSLLIIYSRQMANVENFNLKLFLLGEQPRNSSGKMMPFR